MAAIGFSVEPHVLRGPRHSRTMPFVNLNKLQPSTVALSYEQDPLKNPRRRQMATYSELKAQLADLARQA
jgi:hypothetical protein